MCGHLLDVIVPQIVRQLLGCSGTVLIFLFELSGGLIWNNKSGSQSPSGSCLGGTYRCLADMFRNVHVDHSIAFAEDPFNVILGGIGLANVSNGEFKWLATILGTLTIQQLCASSLLVTGSG